MQAFGKRYLAGWQCCLRANELVSFIFAIRVVQVFWNVRELHRTSRLNDLVSRLLKRRDESFRRLMQAEELFEAEIGFFAQSDMDSWFSVHASQAFAHFRRRLEASYHAPVVTDILRHFRDKRFEVKPLRSYCERVWWMTRFKRFFGERGVPYLSADELFTLNPPPTKRILIDQVSDAEPFFVKAGWLVMACSGQTYGLNGSVALVTKVHENCFLSHDLVRIVPREDCIRPGYLLIALTHPRLGRPLVIRNAYGSSIPHLEPADVAEIPIVRLDPRIEQEIADIAEDSVRLRDEADKIENDADLEAERYTADLLLQHA